MRGLRVQSMLVPWTVQCPAVHDGSRRGAGSPARAGLTHAHAGARPACTRLCVRVSIGPAGAIVDLCRPAADRHRLMHHAAHFNLLSHVYSLFGLRLDCSWTCWTLFIILNLAMGLIWIES